MLLNEVSARYVVGLTATPHRQDGHQKIMFMVAGPVHKQEVTVYDYLDTGLPMLGRMYRKREKGYKAMGYRFVSSGQEKLL